MATHDFTPTPPARTPAPLFVVIHGYAVRKESMRGVVKTIEASFPSVDSKNIFFPEMELNLLSRVSLLGLTKELLDAISDKWNPQVYSEVILIGHSLGGLITRKIYVAACGETDEAPIEKELRTTQPVKWAKHVSRLVLLASMDRGWSLSHEVAFSQGILQLCLPIVRHWSNFGGAALVLEILSWLLMFVLLVYGNLTISTLLSILAGICLIRCLSHCINPKRPRFVVLQAERGQPFVEKLRFQWARMRWRAWEDSQFAGQAAVIGLLGTDDWLVRPEDASDPVFDVALDSNAARNGANNSQGRKFYFALEVPYSDHRNIVQFLPDKLNCKPSTHSKCNETYRQKLFAMALSAPTGVLSEQSVQLLDDAQVARVDIAVTDVLFVVHGIRDRGFWTQHLAQRIRKYAATDKRKFKIIMTTETSRYGYFAILPFLLSRSRQNKVSWLIDQCAKNCALYPNAEFHYVGHSNGTYLAAQALLKLDSIRFRNMVLAGSVLPCDFDWDVLINSKQVTRVLNYVATNDWVVGVFPWAIGWMQRGGDRIRHMIGKTPRRDLGSAAHDGFTLKTDLFQGYALYNKKYVKGGHDAALKEGNWDAIAQFITDGDAAIGAQCIGAKPSAWLMVFIRIFFLVGITTIGAGLVKISPWGGHWLQNYNEWKQFIYFALSSIFIFWSLRRI